MKDGLSAHRDFLRAVGLGAVVGIVPFSVCGSAFGKVRDDVVRFGLCADVQKDIMHDADWRLKW